MWQAYRRITPPQPCDDLPDYCGWTENAHLIGLWRAGRAATEGRRVTQALPFYQDSIIAYFYYAEHTTALFLHLLQMFQTSDFRLSVRNGIHKVATGTRM